MYLSIYLSRDGPYHRVRDYYVQAESTPVLDEDLVREKGRDTSNFRLSIDRERA